MNALTFYQTAFEIVRKLWPDASPKRYGSKIKINDSHAIKLAWCGKASHSYATQEFNAAVVDLDNGIIVNSTKGSICIDQLDTFLEYVKTVIS